MRLIVSLFLFLVSAAPATAAVVSREVPYRSGGEDMVGYIAWDDAVAGRRPAVLVIHDWMGEAPFDRTVCDRLAGLGYAAFAADIYGKGVRPRDSKEAGALAGKYRSNRPLMRARARDALDVLLASEAADPSRAAAMGYCFGGGVSLELARSGAPLAGVVSFHGNLDTPDPGDARAIKARVLVLHGADDPFVPPEQVSGFMKEMRDARVDWQLVSYGNAVHSFTNPAAGSDNSKGSAYNEKADRRSWEAMRAFFEEVFKQGGAGGK